MNQGPLNDDNEVALPNVGVLGCVLPSAEPNSGFSEVKFEARVGPPYAGEQQMDRRSNYSSGWPLRRWAQREERHMLTPTNSDDVEEAQEAPKEELTWIGIELIDADGYVMAGEPFCVEDGAGKVRKGRLDSHGRAMIRSLSPGRCKVSFPEVDTP